MLNIPDFRLGPATKGFCCPEPQDVADFVAASPTLFDGSLTFPVMTLERNALAHNINQLAVRRRHGLHLAPHGKTTMAPAIFEAQLAAGAWGLTVATGQQLMAAYSFGVRRILVANQILDPAVLRWVASTSHKDPAVEIIHYIDSATGVDSSSAIPTDHRFRVVIELGFAGGRTGVRSVDDVVPLAEYARDHGIVVAGVSGYEGALDAEPAVRTYLRQLRQAGTALVESGEVDGPQILVSAGGSAFFDLVADELGGIACAGRPVLTLLRSGSYVTHDHGVYQRKTPFNRIDGQLRPALRVWAQASSRPEPQLAMLGMGNATSPSTRGCPCR